VPRDALRRDDPERRAAREREERIRLGAELAGVTLSEFLLRAADAEARRLMAEQRNAALRGRS
jgi:uncharacterized protein (DUF1778 family)